MGGHSKHSDASYYSTKTSSTSGKSRSSKSSSYSTERYTSTVDYAADLNVGHKSSGRSQAYGASKVDDFERRWAEASRHR